ncbi:MAG: HAD hydrolase-like protein, partial [Candidatus Micrarchaeota archaeon]
GLSKYFTEVVGEIHDKTDTIAGLVKKYELDPKRTFYVGDTSGDVEAGKAAGVKTIGITWGFQHKSILAESKPDFLIDDIKEIKKIVSKN